MFSLNIFGPLSACGVKDPSAILEASERSGGTERNAEGSKTVALTILGVWLGSS